jgi:hypothetical protein
MSNGKPSVSSLISDERAVIDRLQRESAEARELLREANEYVHPACYELSARIDAFLAAAAPKEGER